MDNNPWHDLGKQIGDTVRSVVNDVGNSIKSATQQPPPPFANQPEQQGTASPPAGAPSSPHTEKGPVYNAEPVYPNYRDPNRPLVRPNGPLWQNMVPPKAKRNTNRFAGVAQISLGVLGIVLSAVGMLAVGIVGAVGLLSGGIGISLPMIILSGALVASSGVTMAGINKRGLASRAYRIQLLLEDKKVCTIEQLASSTGRSPAQVRQDVKRGMKAGFLPQVRMDTGETCAIFGEEAFQLYLDSETARKQKEQEEKDRERRLGQAGSAEIERFAIEGEKALSSLRDVRVHIQDEQVAVKIKKLETTIEKIFNYVRQHPQKLPATRKFTSYYLPTTLKILQKYRQYDSMDIQLTSVQKAMQEIEDTLDTLETAYTNLLENLYHEDTLDVTTDVEVLQSMLQQEGLAKDALQQEINGTR